MNQISGSTPLNIDQAICALKAFGKVLSKDFNEKMKEFTENPNKSYDTKMLVTYLSVYDKNITNENQYEFITTGKIPKRAMKEESKIDELWAFVVAWHRAIFWFSPRVVGRSVKRGQIAVNLCRNKTPPPA